MSNRARLEAIFARAQAERNMASLFARFVGAMDAEAHRSKARWVDHVIALLQRCQEAEEETRIQCATGGGSLPTHQP